MGYRAAISCAILQAWRVLFWGTSMRSVRAAAVSAVLINALALVCAHAQAQQPSKVAPARPLTPQANRLLISTPAERLLLRSVKARPEALELRAAIARLPRNHVDLAAIDKSAVPVLLSARPQFVQNLRLYTAANRFTAATEENGIVIEINGTRAAVAAPERFRLPPSIRTIPLRHASTMALPTEPAQPAAPGRRLRLGRTAAPQLTRVPVAATPETAAATDALHNVRVDQTSSGADVTFTRFGFAYNVSLDCGAGDSSDPEAIGPAPQRVERSSNANCNGDAALALSRELEVVGGGEAPQ
jgi:hypothetical protein